METTDKITKDYMMNMKLREEITVKIINKDYQRIRSIGVRLFEKGYSFIIYKERNKDTLYIKRIS